MTCYKIVQTDSGPTVAHLCITSGARICQPEGVSDSRIRTTAVTVEWLENNAVTGWGPVDARTVYRVGCTTEADSFNADTSVISGAGLHAFQDRSDATNWMQQADI